MQTEVAKEMAKKLEMLKEGRDPVGLGADWEFTHPTIKFGARVGDGSFGSVWKVSRGGIEMAAKQIIIHGSDRAQAVKHLRREQRAMREVGHTNIVKVLGVCVDHPEWVCLLMELLPRQSLELIHRWREKRGNGRTRGLREISKLDYKTRN